MVGFVLLASFALGCRVKSNRVPPICSFNVATENELSSKTLSAEAWLGLVSPSLDRRTMTRRGLLRDSCGRLTQDVTQDKTFVCPNAQLDAAPVPGDVAEPTDMVMSQAGEDRVLLWAATDEFTDGQAQGPVALALWTEAGIEIHAAGVLRGYRRGARMKLHHIGPTPVLIVESDRCDADGACIGIAQFVPVMARRFRELPLYGADGGCIGRAQLELSRVTEVPLDAHRVRRFRLTRSIELGADGIALTDLISSEDHDRRYPDTPPTPFRRTTATRPLELHDNHLQLRDQDLWERVLQDDGTVSGDVSPRGW